MNAENGSVNLSYVVGDTDCPAPTPPPEPPAPPNASPLVVTPRFTG